MWKNFKDVDIIPSKFTVGGSEYEVNLVNHMDDIGGNYGDFISLKHKIRVALNGELDGDTIKIREDEVLKTYLHELAHCFNYYYNNTVVEEFANAFANFFYEYLHTKE